MIDLFGDRKANQKYIYPVPHGTRVLDWYPAGKLINPISAPLKSLGILSKIIGSCVKYTPMPFFMMDDIWGFSSIVLLWRHFDVIFFKKINKAFHTCILST
jgi:hypothetical protein